MSDAALASRVAALETELATLRGATAAPSAAYWAARGAFLPTPPEPRTTTRINELVGSNGLPRDPREVRRLVEAVALCKGAPSPRQDVPKGWESVTRVLHANLTVKKLPWREALQQAGLTPPDDLTPHTRAVRGELHGLWGQLPPLVGWVQKNSTASHVYKDLTSLYRRLLE